MRGTCVPVFALCATTTSRCIFCQVSYPTMRRHTTQGSSSAPNQVIGCGLVIYLKLLSPFCQARFSSTLIFTHRNISSSPPLKSIPSCKMSPSYRGYALLSIPGGDNRIWFKNVPLELLISLTYHWPLSHQNSQCRRETTFDLNPTGADGFP